MCQRSRFFIHEYLFNCCINTTTYCSTEEESVEREMGTVATWRYQASAATTTIRRTGWGDLGSWIGKIFSFSLSKFLRCEKWANVNHRPTRRERNYRRKSQRGGGLLRDFSFLWEKYWVVKMTHWKQIVNYLKYNLLIARKKIVVGISMCGWGCSYICVVWKIYLETAENNSEFMYVDIVKKSQHCSIPIRTVN